MAHNQQEVAVPTRVPLSTTVQPVDEVSSAEDGKGTREWLYPKDDGVEEFL